MRKLVLFVLFVSFASALLAQAPKNVILFIGDGMALPQRMLADEFSRKMNAKPLCMNQLPFHATTRTVSANALVTDSAASATAIACGVKTKNGAVGLTADQQLIDSCAVFAKKSGRKVGICSTAPITHATPAGFYAHQPDRNNTDGITKDLARADVDFFAGGGLACNPNYETIPEKNGYRHIKTRAEFNNLTNSNEKILATFAKAELSLALKNNENEPTLAEITKKAIEMLDNENGFFLMVEGGLIDWCCHKNDIVSTLHETIALDEAVRVACQFQEKSPDTLIIVTGDHETGGLSLGSRKINYELYPEKLLHQKKTLPEIEENFAKLVQSNEKLTFSNVKPFLYETFGFSFGSEKEQKLRLADDEKQKLKEAFKHDIALYANEVVEEKKYDSLKKFIFITKCCRLLAQKAGYTWNTHCHSNLPVLTTAKGPGADKFSGFIENTDIGRLLKEFFAK